LAKTLAAVRRDQISGGHLAPTCLTRVCAVNAGAFVYGALSFTDKVCVLVCTECVIVDVYVQVS
jgi:hypothetical protein